MVKMNDSQYKQIEEKKEQELKKASVTISMKDELLSKTEVNGNQIV